MTIRTAIKMYNNSGSRSGHFVTIPLNNGTRFEIAIGDVMLLKRSEKPNKKGIFKKITIVIEYKKYLINTTPIDKYFTSHTTENKIFKSVKERDVNSFITFNGGIDIQLYKDLLRYDDNDVERLFDDNGNCIHEIDCGGDKTDYEYDQYNNCIHEKSSNGSEEWFEYDENCNLIYRKSFHGRYKWTHESWLTYDNNNYISRKDSDGSSATFEYDTNGNRIHEKFIGKNGQCIDESWMDYDKNGNCIHKREKCIHTKGGTDPEQWMEYDQYGNCIYNKYIDSHSNIIENCWYEYDENNRLIKETYSSGSYCQYIYDDDGYSIKKYYNNDGIEIRI